jgi:glutaredoxin-related protein
MKFKIDNLQYCNWSRKIFEINREAGLDAVHVTIVYHEDFDEHLNEIQKWKKLFEENSDLIFLGKILKILKKLNKKRKQQFFLDFKIAHLLRMILI